jgi:hypothetical protein
LRTLLERHNHTFTEDGEVTGDLVKIQVKGGRSWRRADGYAVPVGDHGSTWADGNIPVLCVVRVVRPQGVHQAAVVTPVEDQSPDPRAKMSTS